MTFQLLYWLTGETTSAIFSFQTNEQNGRQTIRTDAIGLRMDISSWWMDAKTVQTDVETIWMDVRTVQTDVAILRTDANVFWTDMQSIWTVCQTLWTDFFKMNSLPVQMDNHQCLFCLSRSQLFNQSPLVGNFSYKLEQDELFQPIKRKKSGQNTKQHCPQQCNSIVFLSLCDRCQTDRLLLVTKSNNLYLGP